MEQNNSSSVLLWHIAAVVIVFLWGTTFVNTKILLMHGMEPSGIFLIRFAVSWAGMWLLSHRRLTAKTWRDELHLLLLGITGGSLYFLTENTALQYSQATNVSFIVCCAPLIAVMIAIVIQHRGKHLQGENAYVRQKKGWTVVSGSIIAVSGLFLVIFNGQHILHLNPAGDILALLAAVSWAVYTILLYPIMYRYETSFVARKVFFYGAVTILPVILSKEKPFDAMLIMNDPVVGMNLLYLSVIPSLLCFCLWNKTLQKNRSQQSNELHLPEPNQYADRLRHRAS